MPRCSSDSFVSSAAHTGPLRVTHLNSKLLGLFISKTLPASIYVKIEKTAFRTYQAVHIDITSHYIAMEINRQSIGIEQGSPNYRPREGFIHPELNPQQKLICHLNLGNLMDVEILGRKGDSMGLSKVIAGRDIRVCHPLLALPGETGYLTRCNFLILKVQKTHEVQVVVKTINYVYYM
ncbi:hypothetical protein J6590_081237 [Homalodisca vitripennis]|nr:hypothetical protein J6590_081237 [Homalodisca vitripennis]